MRALHVPHAGNKPILGIVPTPEIDDGSVLIRVQAAGLNPIDNVLASGQMAHVLAHEYPLVVGRDAAGIVEAVGAGVDHVQIGDRVFGNVLLTPPLQAGTVAEYAVLPAASVNVVPDGMDFVTAAAIPLSSAAASAAVTALGDVARAGSVILVNGASGGVGSFVVQLLAELDVVVVATGLPSDVKRLLELGATSTVDYTAGAVSDQVLAAYPEGVDALVTLTGNTPDLLPLDAVKKGGVVSITTSGPTEDVVAGFGLIGRKILANATREVTGPIAEKVANGHFKVSVAEVLDLDHALDGLATLAAGSSHGKIVVSI